MLFNLINAEYEVSILAFEEKVSKFDTTYFGYVKILNYRTWCYFTKSQVDFIKSLMSLKKSKDELKNYTSGVHFSKKKAQEEKHYLNTFLFNFISATDPSRLKYVNSNYFRDYLLGPWKTHSFYQWYLSDREEVVFKEKVHFPMKSLKKRFLLRSTMPDFLNLCTDMNDLITKLLPRGEVSSEFFKEFKTFFLKHKLHFSYNHYEINLKLINACRFLRYNFTVEEVSNFETYRKLIHHIFKNHKSFSCFTECRYLPEWSYCFNTLSGKSRVKSFLKWKFYAQRIEEMQEVLKSLEPLNPPFKKFDDPVYSFNFFSKRYAESSPSVNLILSNPNSRWEEKFETDIRKITLEGLSIKKVETFKELIQIGLKLHNCAGNEENKETYLKSFNFVVTKGEEVLYLGTIKRGHFSQLKGFKNSSPPKEVFDSLNEQFKKFNFISCTEDYKDVCVQSYR